MWNLNFSTEDIFIWRDLILMKVAVNLGAHFVQFGLLTVATCNSNKSHNVSRETLHWQAARQDVALGWASASLCLKRFGSRSIQNVSRDCYAPVRNNAALSLRFTLLIFLPISISQYCTLYISSHLPSACADLWDICAWGWTWRNMECM